MTCIVLLRDGPFMYMAGDRRVASGSEYSRYPVPKVANRDGLLIGGAGRRSLTEEILYGFTPPKRAKSLTDVEYVRRSIYHGILNHLKDLDEVVDVDSKDVTFLIGYAGMSFELHIDDEDVDFGQVQSPYAIGSGASVAKGAMSAMALRDELPESVIEAAMLAAAAWNLECSQEYDLIKQEI